MGFKKKMFESRAG